MRFFIFVLYFFTCFFSYSQKNDNHNIIQHVFVNGDDLEKLCIEYNVNVNDILGYNSYNVREGLLKDDLNEGDTIYIHLKSAYLKNKNRIIISVLLPFYSSAINEDDLNIESLLIKSNVALDFYKGIMLAYDSLLYLGYSISLNIFDTENDSSIIDSISNLSIVKRSDIIFGPLHSHNFKFFSNKFRFHKKKIISPLSFKNVVSNNNNVYQTTPNEKSQMNFIISFVKERYFDKKILILGNQQNMVNVDYVYNMLKKHDSINLKKHVYINIDSVHNKRMHDLELLDESENIIIIPSGNKNFVSSALSVLSTMKDTSFIVFGFNVWDRFENLDFEDLEFLNVHYIKLKCLTSNLDYDFFVDLYKEHYSSYPTYFALSAYRQFMFFVNHSYSDLFDFKKSFREGYQNMSFDFVTQHRYKQITVE